MKQKMTSKKEQEIKQFESEIKDIVLNNVRLRIDALLESDKNYSKYLKMLQSRNMDPFEVADKISRGIFK